MQCDKPLIRAAHGTTSARKFSGAVYHLTARGNARHTESFFAIRIGKRSSNDICREIENLKTFRRIAQSGKAEGGEVLKEGDDREIVPVYNELEIGSVR